MDLQEQITALNGEKNHLMNIIETLSAEKVALDQMLVICLKECHQAKRDVCLKDSMIGKLNNQIQSLLQEKEMLTASLKSATDELNKPEIEQNP